LNNEGTKQQSWGQVVEAKMIKNLFHSQCETIITQRSLSFSYLVASLSNQLLVLGSKVRLKQKNPRARG
jgi:hypothetical protein